MSVIPDVLKSGKNEAGVEPALGYNHVGAKVEPA